MRKHLICGLAPVIVVVLLLVGVAGVVHAGSPLKLAQDWMVMGPRAQIYLIGGESSIEPAGTGKVRIYGITLANQEVEVISVTLCLEVYDSSMGTWEDVDDWPHSTTYTSFTEEDVLVTVQSGRTYRVRALHEIWNAGVYESDWSVTPGAFVP